MTEFLSTDLKYLKGVGEKRAASVEKYLEISTIRDLLYNFPYRHVDRTKFYRISELHGEDLPMIQIKGRFISFNMEGEGARKRLVGVFSDGEKLMQVVWFAKINFIKDSYQTGVDYIIFGKPNHYNGIYSMIHPEIERFNPEKPLFGFQGIYTLPEAMKKKGFSYRWIQKLVGLALDHPRFAEVHENLPQDIINRYRLLPIKEALQQMHRPTSSALLQKAIERFKFEELFYLELNILRYSLERSIRLKGYKYEVIGDTFNNFYEKVLPFNLTNAQKRVLKEIWADMKSGRQMNRLLQGDVGSGKTMVAYMSMLMGIDNGYQSALMAPTEILASQHYETIRQWADPIGVRVALLTGNTKQSVRNKLLAELASGEIDIIIGTHALIENRVIFKRLGLAVIDEQHRFGVAQRAALWNKTSEYAPHVLVMTATPIPRTLAMTVYGDLEVSVIDELPPGRKPVTTLLRYDNNRGEVDRLIMSQLKSGRQIYIVYPLIEDNEKLDLKSLEYGYQRTCDFFPGYEVCFVHGKLKAEEKERQMEKFVSGKARIMVSTTVIEVGVNVPNATVMVIENAERFGLSQLHQLRGRVGRGADKSYCVLMGKASSGGDTKKRLNIMTETNDGFIISEADMKIRGPGDMEGTQQSGVAFNLRVANLARDGQILSRARGAATDLLKSNTEMLAVSSETLKISPPDSRVNLTPQELAIVKRELALRFPKTIDWSLIS